MQSFHWLDIVVILVFFIVVFGIAAYYSKKAGKDTSQFFLSGRDMPWYIAGTAMVATTFAADTPLVVISAGLVGTARTDSFQFVFAMVGCIILAVIVVRLPQIGGLAALKARLAPQVLDFLPRVGNVSAGGVTGGALAITAGAGMGAVLILRWFWWRINAWSEISAMIAPLVIYPIARYGFGIQPPITLYPTVLGTTIVWLLVTFATRPAEESKLVEFYRRTHPGGAGWKHIAAIVPEVKEDSGFGRLFLNWALGIVVVYSFLFGIGEMLFGGWLTSLLIPLLGFAAAWMIWRDLKKRGFGPQST